MILPLSGRLPRKILAAIEEKMTDLARQDLSVSRSVMPRDDAVALFRGLGEEYKAQIIESIPADEELSLYRQGEFIDLCRGPHVPSTGKSHCIQADQACRGLLAR